MVVQRHGICMNLNHSQQCCKHETQTTIAKLKTVSPKGEGGVGGNLRHWWREADTDSRIDVGTLHARNSNMNNFINRGTLIKNK